MPPTPLRSACPRISPAWLALVPLAVLLSSCDQPTPLQEGKPRQTSDRSRSSESGHAKSAAAPPQVTARIENVKPNWKDHQQTFNLILANAGDHTETVHAIVYAKNDKLDPPRRGISPPTAFSWFNLAGSKDGQLTAANIESAWKADAFTSARGGRLRKSWDVKVDPESTETVEAAHDLDETSPHPKWKGKKLGKQGYTEYEVWLFTADGQCFFQERFGADGHSLNPKPPPPKPEAKKPPESQPSETPKVVDAKPPETKPSADSKLEAQAANDLRLATYYLEQNRRQDAKDKLNFILRKYPGTAAARKAQEMLKNLS